MTGRGGQNLKKYAQRETAWGLMYEKSKIKRVIKNRHIAAVVWVCFSHR